MILNGNFLGLSYLMYQQPLPIASAYNKVKFYGSNIVDDIHIQNYEYSDSQIQSLDINDVPGWDAYTLLLSQFASENLQAGNIINVSSPITKWIINRKASDETIFKKLSEVDVNTTQYVDYTVQRGKKYIYDIFPKTSSEIGEPLETSPVSVGYWGWFLVDSEDGICYRFDLNIESGDMTNETDFTEFKGYSKYSGFAWGNRDIMRGSINAIGGYIDVNGNLVDGIDYIENLRNFINNKKEKYLKNSKGQIFKVVTTNFRYKFMDDLMEQVFNVSFDFIESSAV